MPKIEPDDPMKVYLDGSDWKSKCAKLLEALREIADNSYNESRSVSNLKSVATKAIKEFEENK